MDDAFTPDSQAFDPAFGPFGQSNPMLDLQASGLYPQFYMRPVKNEAQSAQAGIDIFVEQEWCKIYQRGDSANVIDKPIKLLTEEQKKLFKPIYDQWKRTKEMPKKEGTPLEEVAWLNTAQVATLKAMHVDTLQDLAGLDDNAIGRMPMGGREMVVKAQNQVKAAKDAAFVNFLAEKDKEQKQVIEALQADNRDLKARLDELCRQLGVEEKAPPQKKRA